MRVAPVAPLPEGLRKWEQDCAEVESAGAEFSLSQTTKKLALMKLVPKELESQIAAKPELRTFSQRLRWVKHLLAHNQARRQAAAITGARNKDDMVIGAVTEDTAASSDDALASQLAPLLQQLVQKGRGNGGQAVKGGQAGNAARVASGGTLFRPPTGIKGGGKIREWWQW